MTTYIIFSSLLQDMAEPQVPTDFEPPVSSQNFSLYRTLSFCDILGSQ